MQGYVQLQSVRLPAAEDEEGVSDDQADDGEDARGQKPKKQTYLELFHSPDQSDLLPDGPRVQRRRRARRRTTHILTLPPPPAQVRGYHRRVRGADRGAPVPG